MQPRVFFVGSERTPNQFLRKRKQKQSRLILLNEERVKMVDQNARCVICEKKRMKKNLSFMIFLQVKYTDLHITAAIVRKALHQVFFYYLSNYDAHNLRNLFTKSTSPFRFSFLLVKRKNTSYCTKVSVSWTALVLYQGECHNDGENYYLLAADLETLRSKQNFVCRYPVLNFFFNRAPKYQFT